MQAGTSVEHNKQARHDDGNKEARMRDDSTFQDALLHYIRAIVFVQKQFNRRRLSLWHKYTSYVSICS